jgi:hypothetical protein
MRAIVVMVAKEPVPTQVKTRLCPDLSPARAAEIYTLFVQDMMEEMSAIAGDETVLPGGRRLSVTLAVACSPEGAEKTFESILPAPIRIFPQQGTDLGARLAHIFSKLCGEGYDQVHIINSDSPDMPCSLVRESTKLLAMPRTDLVLGPCDDGGYYLIGLKKPVPELFDGIPWSTAEVLEKTLERAGKLGLSISLLDPWYDIDTCQDLLKFLERNEQRKDEDHGPGQRTLSYLRNGAIGAWRPALSSRQGVKRGASG